jgi:hypothetical protein
VARLAVNPNDDLLQRMLAGQGWATTEEGQVDEPTHNTHVVELQVALPLL